MPIQHVGRPIKRLEDPKLVQGRDAYVNDVRLDGALSLAFARSPHAHAVIRRIDGTAAKKIPGVVAGLTGADITAEGGVVHTPIGPEMFASMNRQGYTMLADGRVRHVGEPVVVVAAETGPAAGGGGGAVGGGACRSRGRRRGGGGGGAGAGGGGRRGRGGRRLRAAARGGGRGGRAG